jgi:hypothetical protein
MSILGSSLEEGLDHDMRQHIPSEMVPPLQDAKEISRGNPLLRPSVPSIVADTE